MLAAGRSGEDESSILSSISFVVGEVKSSEVVVEVRRMETAAIRCGSAATPKRTPERKQKRKVRCRV